MTFYSLIVKKLPRQKIHAMSFLICIVSYVLLFSVFFFLKPGNYIVNTILVALSGAFQMVAGGVNNIGATVMIADIVDYGEWKTGKRGDSVMFSVQTLITKFAGAVAALILGIGIAVSGLPTITDVTVKYNENINGKQAGQVEKIQIFTDENDNFLIKDNDIYNTLSNMDEIDSEKLIKVDEDEEIIKSENLTVLRAFMFITPIPLSLIGYIIYRKKYWLFGEKYDSIKQEIDQRRNEDS